MGVRRVGAFWGGVLMCCGVTFSSALAEDEPGYCQTHDADSVFSIVNGLVHLCAWSVGLDSDKAVPEQRAPATAAIQAPPLPPVPARSAKSFVVFFGFGMMDLNDAAKTIVSDAVRTAKSDGFTKIRLVGNADTAEQDAYVLSLARAQSVRDQMQSDGLDVQFDTEGKAATDPKIPTPPGTQEQLNRRVVIDLER